MIYLLYCQKWNCRAVFRCMQSLLLRYACTNGRKCDYVRFNNCAEPQYDRVPWANLCVKRNPPPSTFVPALLCRTLTQRTLMHCDIVSKKLHEFLNCKNLRFYAYYARCASWLSRSTAKVVCQLAVTTCKACSSCPFGIFFCAVENVFAAYFLRF